jgi:two-component system cell cycle response regulator
MSSFSPEFEPLLAVVIAEIDDAGTLLEANAGFLRLIRPLVEAPIGANVARFFVQPDFPTLVRRVETEPDAEVYRGLLTVGDYMGKSRSLRARVWRRGGRLCLLAEFDIEELESLTDVVLELNRDYASAQLALAQANLELQQRETQILALSLTDSLTGVGNRRLLDQALAREVGRSGRMAASLGLLMADLDHFKRVNDTYGHDAGDKVLAAFGDLLRRQMRAIDVIARFGGEEFVMLLPDTDRDGATDAAERIRAELKALRVAPLAVPVTVSIGVVILAPGEQGESLLRRADKALYEAKAAGRDRVVVG